MLVSSSTSLYGFRWTLEMLPYGIRVARSLAGVALVRDDSFLRAPQRSVAVDYQQLWHPSSPRSSWACTAAQLRATRLLSSRPLFVISDRFG